MIVFIGSDEKNETTDVVINKMASMNMSVEVHGALAPSTAKGSSCWVMVAKHVAQQVQQHVDSMGILFCHTGTGVSIVANKFSGIRAALCFDAETAKGARKWNNANVLAISLRLASPTVALEILDAWLNTNFDADDQDNAICLSHLTNIDSALR